MKIKHFKTIFAFLILLALLGCESNPHSTLNHSPEEVKRNKSSLAKYKFKTIKKDGKEVRINKDYGNAVKDIVIFSTNDGLSSFNDNLGLSSIKYYVDHFDRNKNYATLVDTGNFSAGSTEAEISKGKSSIDIINKVGYDIIVPGSYEFNYGIDTFFENMNSLNAHVICCNLYDIKNSQLPFAPYVIYKYGNINVGFVGVISPETIYLKNNYDKFFDENGNQLIYFFEDQGGNALYERVQECVDACINDGADKIVLLAHLGIEGITDEWTSTKVIANTKNIDAVIDGHSMEVLDNGLMINKVGKFIPLVQAGSNYGYLGAINISEEDYINQAVLKERSVNTKDEKFQKYIDDTLKKYNKNDE